MIACSRRGREFIQNIAQDREIELDHYAQKWFSGTGLDDGSDGGRFDANYQRLTSPVLQSPVTKNLPLCALDSGANSRFVNQGLGPPLVIGTKDRKPTDRRNERAPSLCSVRIALNGFS